MTKREILALKRITSLVAILFLFYYLGKFLVFILHHFNFQA